MSGKPGKRLLHSLSFLLRFHYSVVSSAARLPNSKRHVSFSRLFLPLVHPSINPHPSPSPPPLPLPTFWEAETGRHALLLPRRVSTPTPPSPPRLTHPHAREVSGSRCSSPVQCSFPTPHDRRTQTDSLAHARTLTSSQMGPIFKNKPPVTSLTAASHTPSRSSVSFESEPDGGGELHWKIKDGKRKVRERE